MKQIILIVSLLFVMVGSAVAGTDWKLYAHTSDGYYHFFNLKSTKRAGNIMRIWIEKIKSSEIYDISIKHKKKILDNIFSEWAHHGVDPNNLLNNEWLKSTLPPINIIKGEASNDSILDTIVAEYVINNYEPKIKSKSYYEFDCSIKYVRMLSRILFDNTGKIVKIINMPTDWFYFPPDSIGDNFQTYLCK